MKAWLRERILWWRCFFPVILAHKPLCKTFDHHHIYIRNIPICRSCLALYSGAGLATVGLAFYPDILINQSSNLMALAVTSLVLSIPIIYRKYPRWAKDGMRMWLGSSGPIAIGFLIYGLWQQSLLLTGLLWSAKLLYNNLRLRQHQHTCEKCPEYGQKGPCSGFQTKAHRMRLYERMLERHLLATTKQ